MQALDEEQLELVHEATLDLLENLGIEVLGDQALDLFRRAGADVGDDGIVRMDRALVMQTIASAPETFTLTPRNPDRALVAGADEVHFGLVSGPPNVHDAVNGRRAGNMKDYRDLIRLGQAFDVIGFFGNQAIAPTDLPAGTRHLDTTIANLTLADKPFFATGIGAGRCRDAVELCAIARGLTLDEMVDHPTVGTNINVNSPRKLDDAMAYGAMQMAMLGQAVVVTPFTLMGAMTPATMAGALVQQNAEALLGVCLVQLTRPGAPVIYGGLHLERGHALGLPGLRHPGELVREHRRRAARQTLRPALPHQRLQRVERGGRAGGLGDADGAVGLGHGPRQLHLPRRRLARGRARRLVREGGRGLRDAPAHAKAHGAGEDHARGDRPAGGDGRGRPPAATSSAAITRWRASGTPSTSRSCRTGRTRRTGGSRAPGTPRRARPRPGSGCWPSSRRRRRTPRSPEALEAHAAHRREAIGSGEPALEPVGA